MNQTSNKPLPDSRFVISTLLLVQALAVGGWWVLLLNVPASRKYFVPDDVAADSLLVFLLADLLAVVLVSLICAWAVRSGKAFSIKLIWFLTGAASYAALYCLAESIRSDQAWISSAMMAAMTGLMWAIGTMFSNGNDTPDLIREQRFSTGGAVAATLVQTVFFWSILLWVIPKGIDEVFLKLGVENLAFEPFHSVGIVLLALASAVGLWSGVTMATVGKGTPLPTATSPELVMKGPYRFVRNPMAVAGIAQGLAVGLWCGSVPILLYSLSGAFFWHCFVRPYEGADLRLRFGRAYEAYCQRVRLWIPTFQRSR